MSQKFTILFAIVLLIIPGLACSMPPQKRHLTWSVTLEIGTPSADREAVTMQTVRILETRLDAFGLLGSEVKIQGNPADGRILVNLPDVPDRERVKRLITARGQLEMTHVISPPSPAPVKTYNTREEAIVSLGGPVPTDRRVLQYADRDEAADSSVKSTADSEKKWVVVESPAIVDGRDLRNAVAFQSRGGGKDYQIAFSLTAAGAGKFGNWTRANINEYLGVVLNDEVKSIAFIRSPISDQGEISGRFTKESAEDLAQVLKSGALPAPVRIVAEDVGK